jgi:hypothetical protein
VQSKIPSIVLLSHKQVTNLSMKVSILSILATLFAVAVAGPVLGFEKRHRKPFRFQQMLIALDHDDGDDGDDGAPAQSCDPPEGCVCLPTGGLDCPH